MTPDEVIAALHGRVAGAEPVPPANSLLDLARACPDWDAPEEEDGHDQMLWSELLPAMPVGPMTHSGGLYSDARVATYVGMIAWAVARLAEVAPSEDGRLDPELRLGMMILSLAHPDDRPWTLVPPEAAASTALRDLALRVVSGLAPRAMLLNSRAYSLRAERPALPVPRGREGWRDLAEIVSDWEVMSPGLLGPFAQLLLRLWPDALARAVADWTDSLALFAIVDALSPADAFELGRLSVNRVVAFIAVIDHTAQFRPVGVDAEQTLTDLLVDVGSDQPVWQAWLEALNPYPVRLPMLQVPLGRALARLSGDAFQSWLTTQTVSPDPLRRGIALPARPDAAACLEAFALSATGDTRREAWSKVWAHWNAWDFGGRDLILDVHASPLDLGVVGHALEALSAADVDALIAVEVEALHAVFGRWWASSSAMISEIHRLQSRIQPLAHAQALRAVGAALERAGVLYAIADPDLEWRLTRLRIT